MKAGRVRVLWTTNFDRTIEDAAAQVPELNVAH